MFMALMTAFLPNLRLTSSSVCWMSRSRVAADSPALPGRPPESSAPRRIPSFRRSPTSPTATASCGSPSAASTENRSGCSYPASPVFDASAGCRSSATTVIRRTISEGSTSRLNSSVIASRSRLAESVRFPNGMEPFAGLGTVRPYRSFFTGPAYACVPPSVPDDAHSSCEGFTLPMSYPTASPTRPASTPCAVRSRASVSAISLAISRAVAKSAGPCSTWPELMLWPSGRYALMSAIVHGSHPQAWSMSSSALTPNIR